MNFENAQADNDNVQVSRQRKLVMPLQERNSMLKFPRQGLGVVVSPRTTTQSLTFFMRALCTHMPKQSFLTASDVASRGPQTDGKTEGNYHPDPKGKKEGGLSFIPCVLCMRAHP